MKNNLIQQYINEATENVLVDCLINIETIIENHIKQNVLSLIGIDNRWGKPEIDRNRADSIIMNHLKETTKEMVTKSLNEIIINETPKLIEKYKDHMQQLFCREFHNQIQYDIKKIAQDKGKEYAKTLAEDQLSKIKESLTPNTFDINDPQFCDSIHGKVQAILIAHKLSLETKHTQNRNTVKKKPK